MCRRMHNIHFVYKYQVPDVHFVYKYGPRNAALKPNFHIKQLIKRNPQRRGFPPWPSIPQASFTRDVIVRMRRAI